MHDEMTFATSLSVAVMGFIGCVAWYLEEQNKERQRVILAQLKGIMNKTELEAGLKQITAQVGKVAAEQGVRFDALTAKVKALEDAINAGEVSPEVETALKEAQAALTALDETIPDAPTA